MTTESIDGASVPLLDAARTAAKQAAVEAAATERDRRITGVSAAAARAAGAFALDAISFGVILRQSGLVTASLVERMVPDGLWE
ncbi:hypothetical protein ABT142_33625, partial [Streptomyces sp. NPDC001857]|uniref:hypothetical protein n=1 Tax=unclassified Streptomyces TaxID=2593676 RepID=UPI00332F4E97